MTAEHAHALDAGGEVEHLHDRKGQLDRTICGGCNEPYVECSKCGLYACLCFADVPVAVAWWWTPVGRADHDAATRATAAAAVLTRPRWSYDAALKAADEAIAKSKRPAKKVAKRAPRKAGS